ncbi:hypothetical protein QYN14_25615 [Rhodococcus ruber]|uniref:hypothetical protein n=1 Tax=Rhodococcus ruber TaxID=1830 RepID=UPI00265B258C|nr:hypothetical protein [Rhodococcus ruber]WKK11927.1 hypothetical protein QYN14_25195 [Rhodococcus ruber]WKK12011.1 hypothetical protein QYN14_25615 [Rhodococcus ruber]
MNLPIFEETRRRVPAALIFDDTLTQADQAEHLETTVELDHLPTTADLVRLAEESADEPQCSDDGDWYALLLIGLPFSLALGLILWALVVSTS